MTLHLEDLHAGQTFELGSKTVSRSDILSFGREFDPQAFHVDEYAASASPFGGLIASGWHTCSVFMRLFVDAVLLDADGRGSPGVEGIRWLAPVRPGDTLRGSAEILTVSPSPKHRDRGSFRALATLTSQDDVVVLRMTVRGLIGSRRQVG